MFKVYRDLEIRIGARGPTGYALDVHSIGGDARGALTLSADNTALQMLVDRLERLDADETLLTDLGQRLFEMLFPNPIRDVYVRSLGMLPEGEALRLKLCFATTEIAVAALPWEFLHDPDNGPLALLNAPIVRYIVHSSRIPILKTALPL